MTTRFADGAVLVAAPVDDAESRAHASALGYRGADAVWAMTRDHDLLHTLLAEARGLPHSPTLHAVATGKPVDPAVADDEERIVFLLARAMNTGIAPA